MTKYIIFSAILFLFAACGEDTSGDRKDGYSDNSKNPEDSLFQAVMDGHDEAMAKMGKLSGYRKQIEQKLDSLNKVKSSAKAGLIKTYEEISGKLKDAEDGMNRWMQEFVIDSAQEDAKRRINYLESEKSKVNKVKDEIFEMLSRADSLLKK